MPRFAPLPRTYRDPHLVLFLLVTLLIGTVGTAGAVTHTVNVADFSFTQANITIAAGDVVRWTWVSGIHTTTNGTSPTDPAAGTLWNAPIDENNLFFERTFSSAGTFPYHCAFHSGLGMNGTITVTGSNTPPVINNPGTQNGTEEVPFSVTVFASDANGDALTMTGSSIPSWATFTDNGNRSATISGTPAIGNAGTTLVTVNANDGNGGTDSESFNIVIASANIVIVTLTSGGFQPASVNITQGYRIRWVKDAGGNHTTTNGTGPTDPAAGTLWNAPLTAGSPTFTRQFNTTGTFPYFCNNHPTDTGTITVSAQPTCSIAGPDPVCENASGLVYTATVLPAGGTVTYSWGITGNGSIVGSTTGSSVSVTATTAGSFTLTLNSVRDGIPADCSKMVTVNTSPTCGITGSSTVCEGATGLSYSATVSPVGGTVTYSWGITGSGSIVGSTTGSSVSVSATTAGSFTLTLDVTRNGCPGQCQKVVTVAASPLCSISGSDPVSPSSTGNIYTSSVSPVGGTVTYSWGITGNGTLSGATSTATATVTAGAAGSFTLTLNVTRNGCPGQCQKVVTVQSASVAATIQLTGTSFVPPQVTIQRGQSVKWQWVDGSHTTTNGSSSAPEHNPGVLWDQVIDSATPTFIRQFNNAGYFPFFCRPHELMGMKGSVTVQDTSTVGVEGDPSATVRLAANPNPFRASTLLSFVLPRQARVSLDLFDVEGRLVLNLLMAELPAGPHEVRWGGWDATHHPVAQGLYLARLIVEDGTVQVQKIMKNN